MQVSNWVYGRTTEGTLIEQREWIRRHLYIAAKEIIDFNIELILNTESFKILDFGAGDQIISYGVKEILNKVDIYSCDIDDFLTNSKNRIEKLLKISLKNSIPYVQNDINNLPYKNSSFDFIFSWSVFEHVSNVDTIMQEIERVLKPNGFLFIQIFPLYYSPWGHHLWWDNQFNPHLHLIDNQLFQKKFDLLKTIMKNRPKFINVIDKEIQSLNKLKYSELKNFLNKYGFTIIKENLTHNPINPEVLNHQYLTEDLTLSEIKVTAKKISSHSENK